MSIAILISVHDGIVLAADSASTLALTHPAGPPSGPNPVVLSVYNNANKIANLRKGAPIGCVAFGAGSIGSASISTLLKDFRQKITDCQDAGFDIGTYTMEGVAKLLTDFLMDHVARLPGGMPKPSLGILVGGYSAGKSLGEGWKIQIDNGSPKPAVPLRKEDEIGISWGGEGEAINRLILGLSPHLPQALCSVITPPPQQPELDRLVAHLQRALQAPLVFAPMPIQDTIDLAEFLVHTAIMFSRFTLGAPSIGGPIEIAAITKHEGFKWIRRKHYYSKELNPDLRHGDSD
jgi:hypothetical protein